MVSGNLQGNSEREIRDFVVGKGAKFFETPGVDELISMVFSLTGELWVARERIARIESLAESKGLWSSKELEAHAQSDGEEHELNAARDAMIHQVFLILKEVAAREINPVKEEPEPPKA